MPSDDLGRGLAPDVVGQEVARAFFTNTIARGRLSHAYLLVGPPGVGKHTFACALTRALLCREGPTYACDTCSSCRTLDSGNHPAFLELTPATGKRLEIEPIREAIRFLSLRQQGSRTIIVDQADRLSSGAANAILKTLEEPPPDVLFLLVSSRPSQLLPTIHSRCHRVPFRGPDPDELETVLRRHDRGVDDPLSLHARCGGSPGRALRLLEGIEECGGPERFTELLSGVGATRPETLIDYLPARPQETKRDRTRRLLELVSEGVWGRRRESAAGRWSTVRNALTLEDLRRGLDGNEQPDLILEELARTLRET